MVQRVNLLDVCEAVKNSLNIVNVVGDLTTISRNHEKKHWNSVCPVCDNAIVIDDMKQVSHCENCCFHGDVITYTMLILEMTLLEATKYLVEKYALEIEVPGV